MAGLTSVDELLAVLSSGAQVVDGVERVDQLAHALQCGDELTRSHPTDVELQVAGLVHDVGHLLAPDAEHGCFGADAVRPLLGERVAQLVELHVPAKRYLVATDAGYANVLSDGSTASLAIQGGAMDEAEAGAFATRAGAADAIVLRRADEAAKVPGRVVPDLEAWRGRLEAVREAARSG